MVNLEIYGNLMISQLQLLQRARRPMLKDAQLRMLWTGAFTMPQGRMRGYDGYPRYLRAQQLSSSRRRIADVTLDNRNA